MKTTRDNFIEKMNEINTEIELAYNYSDGMSFNEFSDRIQDYIYEQEIIYYYKAIEYLKENDPSLKESMELADEIGYSVDRLNSELLATLLYQRQLMDEWCNIQNEVEELFEELENTEE